MRKCIYCEQDISHRYKKVKVCNNKICEKKYKKEKYFNSKIIKSCESCSKDFNATSLQKLCSSCRKEMFIKNRKETLKENIIHQKHYCKKCKKYLFTIDKLPVKNINKEVYIDLCEYCKIELREINSINSSIRMKENNPMFNFNTIIKSTISRFGLFKGYCKIPNHKLEGLSSKEYQQKIMKKNNPMFNDKVKEKAKKTLQENIKSGKTVYKKGKDNSNFKGNRTINKGIRDNLGNWRKKILKKYNYRCVICNYMGNDLHIHHIIPLREIIKKNKNDLNLIDVIYGTTSYFKLLKEVINYHNKNDIGIVVCPTCHSEIDAKYHKK